MISSVKPVRSISISDLIGNIVFDEELKCPAPCEKKISMLEMNPGIFICRILMEDGNLVLVKVMKE